MISDRGYQKYFWGYLEQLVDSCPVVVDRPKGTKHHVFHDTIYPLDYGYLEGTVSGDGAGVDIWIGSEKPASLKGVFITLDMAKRDAEIKLALGCDADEIEKIFSFLNCGSMSAIFISSQIKE